MSSREKVLESPESVDQVIVAEPPDERFSGVLSVRAEMRGTTNAKALAKTMLPNHEKVQISPSHGYIWKSTVFDKY